MVVFATDHNLSAPAQQKSKNITFPPIPKRGRVKAQIFESLAKTVISAAAKAVRTPRNDGGDSGSSSGDTPPPSPCSSDANSDKN
ncbi:conserved hypothetical protein [Ricinus communis]|uniref:Uncharacterized protein n=1 Tax=Ricinus communis TaxID=3988 RepID=B9SW76_RICCO|nr:conserved hypothetical protein [Ricinus communis]